MIWFLVHWLVVALQAGGSLHLVPGVSISSGTAPLSAPWCSAS